MNKIKKAVSIIIGALIGIILCVALPIYLIDLFEEKYDWDKDGIETVGTITELQFSKRSSNWFTYYVDGKEYKTSSAFGSYNLVLGDKFVIKYLKDNPKKIKVIGYRPVFIQSEKDDIDSTIGEVKKLGNATLWGEPKYFVHFDYTARGVKYERSQNLPPNYKVLFPNVDEGKKYKILYWKKNPQRGMIFLNSPK